MKKAYILLTMGVLMMGITACGSLESLLADTSDTRFIRISSLDAGLDVGGELIVTVSWSFGISPDADKGKNQITWSVSNNSIAAIRQSADAKNTALLKGLSPGTIEVTVTVADTDHDDTLVGTRTFTVSGSGFIGGDSQPRYADDYEILAIEEEVPAGRTNEHYCISAAYGNNYLKTVFAVAGIDFTDDNNTTTITTPENVVKDRNIDWEVVVEGDPEGSISSLVMVEDRWGITLSKVLVVQPEQKDVGRIISITAKLLDDKSGEDVPADKVKIMHLRVKVVASGEVCEPA